MFVVGLPCGNTGHTVLRPLNIWALALLQTFMLCQLRKFYFLITVLKVMLLLEFLECNILNYTANGLKLNLIRTPLQISPRIRGEA